MRFFGWFRDEERDARREAEDRELGRQLMEADDGEGAGSEEGPG